MRHAGRFTEFFRDASNNTLPCQECSERKEKYDSCFIKWYSDKYLKGDTQSSDCEGLFKDYQQCLKLALKQKGIYDMIEDARISSPNNDNVRTTS